MQYLSAVVTAAQMVPVVTLDLACTFKWRPPRYMYDYQTAEVCTYALLHSSAFKEEVGQGQKVAY